jgi:hypothetical protein
MANIIKQQTPISKPQPPADPVAAAEQAIAALDRDRSALVAASAQDDAEMSKHAYAARVLHEMGATSALRGIGERVREHDQRLREIDAALVTARSVLKEAQAGEARAQAKEVAAELLKRAARLVQHGQTLDDANTVRAEASCAISEELFRMRSLAHGLGIHIPSHEQLLSMGSRADLTSTMHLPWSRDVGEHLAPRDRRTHSSYVMPWADQIARAARAVLGVAKEREVA